MEEEEVTMCSFVSLPLLKGVLSKGQGVVHKERGNKADPWFMVSENRSLVVRVDGLLLASRFRNPP